ncbi:MAG TPA: dihydrodipicolinate synthase family protein, partial [Armatimonadota bacterium]|nr:dihydrodipicolinate synthase family protein [Armatimonadota bacterium]
VIADGVVTGKGCLLVAAGGGELPFLTPKQRYDVIKTTVEVANDRVHVLGAVQDDGTAICVDLAKQAQDAGALGLQLGPPCLYNNHSEDDVLRFYDDVCSQVEIGILAYNTWWTSLNMTSDLLVKLIQIDNVVGAKWSSPVIHDYLHGYRKCADKVAFIDNQGMHAQAHVMGAQGFVSNTGDFWPQHDLELWAMLERGEYREVPAYLEKLSWPFYEFRGRSGKRTGGEAAPKKVAAELVGRAGGPPLPPTQPLSDAEVAELREIFVKGGVPGLV